MAKITRTNFKVQKDKKGRFIKIGKKKFYLNFLDNEKGGLTERQLIQWLIKRFLPKRRKTKRTDRKPKRFSNVPIINSVATNTQALYDAEKLRGQIAREKARTENLAKNFLESVERKKLKLEKTPLLTYEQETPDKPKALDKSTRDGLFSNLQKLEARKNQLEQSNRITEEQLKEKQSKLDQLDKRSKDAVKDYVTKVKKIEYKKGHSEQLRKMASAANLSTQKTIEVTSGKQKGRSKTVNKSAEELITDLLTHGDNDFTKLIEAETQKEYEKLQSETPKKEAPKIEDDEDIEDIEDDEDDDFENPSAGKIKGKGLWTDEVDKIMSKNPFYIGTVSSDNILSLLPKARKLWKANKPFGFITNTLSSKDGHKMGHWVALYIKPNESISYYDSFGDPAPANIRENLKIFIDEMKPELLMKFKENLIKQQSITTANCGWFAAKFLKDMFSGKPFIETTGFSKVMKSEKEIEKFKKKFRPFGWL